METLGCLLQAVVRCADREGKLPLRVRPDAEKEEKEEGEQDICSDGSIKGGIDTGRGGKKQDSCRRAG